MIDVYLAALPKQESNITLSCAERQREIDGVSNERVRREKYYVWRLLEYAIKNSLGADASRLCFTKGNNGRWSSEGFEFSLSHSGDALSVAISKSPVGVDVERIRVKNADRMASYSLTQVEQAEYSSLYEAQREEWLMRRWCAKEAIFKHQNKDAYIPSKIETAEFFSYITDIEIENEKYIIAVAAEKRDEIRMVYVTENFAV